MQPDSVHTFHIPVMGLAYTIDSPIKVARFGIPSVISIIEDNLVERMRGHYYQQLGSPYQPIGPNEPDYRAKRITDYLNLVRSIVDDQVSKMKRETFQTNSDLDKYFEMLPNDSELKAVYLLMLDTREPLERQEIEQFLRDQVTPGSIDVNIMTKLDKNNLDEMGQVIEDGSDALAALRGYAKSDLQHSSVVLSAGMNPRLFNYMEKHSEFDLKPNQTFDKKIVIKVSDYRSALIQGKMLVKKGLWVSEFRIESGLNCGGHAFASDGYLLGPILEEFKSKRAELVSTLFGVYTEAQRIKGKFTPTNPPALRVTVQGGIGTYEEDRFLREYYQIDGTGWGTPFLLVPEATTVDADTLQLLSQAKEKDVVLSNHSPLGVRFHYLRGTTADLQRQARIKNEKPGSPCTEKFLVSNTEFSQTPICTASRTYQRRKIKELQAQDLAPEERTQRINEVVDKECLCTGLSNAAAKVYQTAPLTQRTDAVNICPGPNIAYFSKVVSLREMIDHIYGRTNLIATDNRPHMFLKELMLYADYWEELATNTANGLDAKRRKYVQEFHKNLKEGISYYHHLSGQIIREIDSLKSELEQGLSSIDQRLDEILQRFQDMAVVHVPTTA